MTAQLTVTEITIIQGHGADEIFLTTTLPCGTWPFKGNATVRMEVAASQGEMYVKHHFGLEPKIIRI